MTCTETPLYNHWCCKGGTCTKPLTLGDKELIRKSGISLLCHDDETGIPYCGDCLADLPHGPQALAHVCGEEMPAAEAEPAPELLATPVVFADEAPAERPARVGDVVFYHGALTGYHGVWEVTARNSRGTLRLFDFDRALENVSPDSVTVVQTKAARKRLRGRKSITKGEKR
jgi:hypothetical protein